MPKSATELQDISFDGYENYEKLRLCTMHVTEGCLTSLWKVRSVALACSACLLICLDRNPSLVVDANEIIFCLAYRRSCGQHWECPPFVLATILTAYRSMRYFSHPVATCKMSSFWRIRLSKLKGGLCYNST